MTLTEELAFEQAEKADREIAAGRYAGPLHGISWGAKDLLDTKGISTTWGARPYKDRVPEDDAFVVRRLAEAGAVLVAFSLGSETMGSIVSPCVQCGTTGLRPTFGRVSRSGAMALSWSFDKIGPICRSVEDTALVLSEINGYDPGDPGSADVPFSFDAASPLTGPRVGYNPEWFRGSDSNELDRKVLEVLKTIGVKLVETGLPDLPYGVLGKLISVDAASAVEELTVSGRDNLLRRQDRNAWPNVFRTARFIPAVEYV